MRVETDGGEVIDLGKTETTPTIGIIDYSRRVTDDFGVTTVVERGFARRLTTRLLVPFEAVDTLQRRLADLRATPALWVADDRFDWLSVRGFYKDFALDLATPPMSYCTLEIDGLAASEVFADPGGDPASDGRLSTLQLLRPTAVTDSALLATSVAEADYPEWSTSTSYALGARVIRAATHRVYESLVAANLGNDQAGTSGKWLDVGPTNRWAMFDQALGTATSAYGTIVVTLGAGSVDAVALLDVIASTVRVQAAGYDRTIAAGRGAITFLDLAGMTGTVTVTIAGYGQVSVGTLLIGRLVGLGITEAAPTAGITDYSRKEVDDFGEVTVVPRAWAKRMSAKALIRTDAVDLVASRIAAVRARPSLWIAQAGVDSLTIYGFFKEFSIEVVDNLSKLSLTVEGLSTAAPVGPLTVAWSNVTDPEGTRPEDNATVGAPAGTYVAGVLAEDVAVGLENFNLRNDRNGVAISAPAFALDGTAVDHVVNTDGSVDISVEWTWGGTEPDIDGFEVLFFQAASTGSYTPGNNPAAESVTATPANRRAAVVHGVAANAYATWAVRAFRIVDVDVASGGIIYSNWSKPTVAGEDPYRPSASVAFAGDVSGTISGAAALDVKQGALAANAGLASDGTIKPGKVDTPAFVPGAVTDGVTVTSSGTFIGDGTEQTVGSVTLVLDYAARVRIDATGAQGYFGDTGSTSWHYSLIVNGTTVRSVGGDAPNDIPTTFRTVVLPAGTHSITFQWNGGSSRVHIVDPEISVSVFYA